jgi:peptidyl-prolyl cis-trans isomerase C
MKKHQLFAFAAVWSTLALAQTQSPQLQNPPSAQPGKTAPSTNPPPSLTAAIVSPDAVVLTVGAEKFTRAQFEEILAALADSGRPIPNPAAKRQVAQQLGELLVLAQEARKRKLDQTSTSKEMMMIQVDTVLAGALQRQVGKDVSPDDAALHAYYDSHKAQYEQVKASHILIRFKGSPVPSRPNQKDLTEEEALAKAQGIEKQLAAGGDFAAIAKTESDDVGTATSGGALNPFSKGQMVPEFEQAVFSQDVGKISEPVKTKYGYHIIKVQERISKNFGEARPDIEKQLKPQLTREAMDRITKQVPVTLDDAYFGK